MLFDTAELGIDITGILKRSTCIASSRTRNLDLEELDMGGPLIFVLLLACIHLLVSVTLVLRSALAACSTRHMQSQQVYRFL